MINTNQFLTLVILGSALTACVNLSLEAPNNVDLSGHWIIDSSLSQDVIFPLPKVNRQKSSVGGTGNRSGASGGRSKKVGGPSGGSKAYQFVRKPNSATAKSMTIEQVSDSMGVRYDSGEYRDVEWGTTNTRKGSVKAGWRREELIIISKGPKGSISESYQLSQDKTMLKVLFDVGGNDYIRIYRLQE